MIDQISKIPLLYHFTDRRNLPVIRQNGGLLPLTMLRKRGIDIPAPGGNEWSHDADAMKGMDQYVHLCFRNSHPMEYAARREGRITETVFLRIHPSVMQFPGVKFTPDVSNKSGVEAMPIDQADELIDFQVLYTRTNWNDAEIKQRLDRAEKCEVLVPAFIPLELISGAENG